MTDSRLPNLISDFRDFFEFENLSLRRSRVSEGERVGNRESEKLRSRSRESESETRSTVDSQALINSIKKQFIDAPQIYREKVECVCTIKPQ